MAVTKIAYANKTALTDNPSIVDANKVTAADMNEIKTCFNGLVDAFNALPTVINNLTSTSTTNALSAAQGKALNDRLNALELLLNNTVTIVTKLNNNLGDLTVEVVDEW